MWSSVAKTASKKFARRRSKPGEEPLSQAFMPKLFWSNIEDIAIALSEQQPGDPLTVRFTDLHKWIVALPDFGDDPAKSNRPNWKLFRWPGSKSIKTAESLTVLIPDENVLSRT